MGRYFYAAPITELSQRWGLSRDAAPVPGRSLRFLEYATGEIRDIDPLG